MNNKTKKKEKKTTQTIQTVRILQKTVSVSNQTLVQQLKLERHVRLMKLKENMSKDYVKEVQTEDVVFHLAIQILHQR
jgi:hypothetical protein